MMGRWLSKGFTGCSLRHLTASAVPHPAVIIKQESCKQAGKEIRRHLMRALPNLDTKYAPSTIKQSLYHLHGIQKSLPPTCYAQCTSMPCKAILSADKGKFWVADHSTQRELKERWGRAPLYASLLEVQGTLGEIIETSGCWGTKAPEVPRHFKNSGTLSPFHITQNDIGCLTSSVWPALIIPSLSLAIHHGSLSVDINSDMCRPLLWTETVNTNCDTSPCPTSEI